MPPRLILFCVMDWMSGRLRVLEPAFDPSPAERSRIKLMPISDWWIWSEVFKMDFQHCQWWLDINLKSCSEKQQPSALLGQLKLNHPWKSHLFHLLLSKWLPFFFKKSWSLAMASLLKSRGVPADYNCELLLLHLNSAIHGQCPIAGTP